ncbi:MAG: AI-2E family transporter [Candidatus Melainabacteria bacterium]|jgi:predicted PurR-regulated permease PerM|nr:AI-2E family transporter [Candidatus Melainabacteria bacterium]
MADQDKPRVDAKTQEQLAKLALVQRQLSIIALGFVALLVCCFVASYFADILRIIGISILLSYLFINVVDWLEKYIHSRAGAIFIVYLLLSVTAIVTAVLVLPAMVYQVAQLGESVFQHIPQIVDKLIAALHPLEEKLHAAKIEVKAMDILSSFASNLPRLDSSQILSRMGDMAFSTVTAFMYGLSVLVVSFYFLLDGHRIRDSIINLFPRRMHARCRTMAEQMDNSLQAFFRGQIVLGLLFGGVMICVYFILGIHYALILGVFLAVWEIVPVIGPPIGFIPAAIVVAIDGMDTIPVNRFAQILILFAIFNGLQWLKDNLVAPRYIGNVIGLHPVMIFIAIMIGARLDGMLGIIFSLPAACVANVLFNNLIVQNKVEQAVASGEASLLPLEEDGSPSGSFSVLKEKSGLDGESGTPKGEGVAQGS